MGRILAVMTVCAWALTCSSAPAATVTSKAEQFSDTHGPNARQTITYTAAPGELNGLTLSSTATATATGGVRLHDPVGITPVAPCVAEDPATAVCPLAGELSVQVALGDGDDTATSTVVLPGVVIDGGPGNDVLTGGTLLGGPGDDQLRGASVRGGPGADFLQGSAVDYYDHATGVTVDLAGGPAGSPGEGDVLAPGATRVQGTEADDVIRAADLRVDVQSYGGDDVIEGSQAGDFLEPGAGNDIVRGYAGDDEIVDETGEDRPGLRGGDDRVYGGPGSDYLYAGTGDDLLDGGPGRDRLVGDKGDDRILARDGERDRVSCNEDARLEDDHVVLDAGDEPFWCAHVSRSGTPRLEVYALERVGTRGLRLLVSCPARAKRACTGTLRSYGTRVKSGKVVQRVRGRRTFAVDPGRRTRLAVPFSARRLTKDFVSIRVQVRTAGRLLTARL